MSAPFATGAGFLAQALSFRTGAGLRFRFQSGGLFSPAPLFLRQPFHQCLEFARLAIQPAGLIGRFPPAGQGLPMRLLPLGKKLLQATSLCLLAGAGLAQASLLLVHLPAQFSQLRNLLFEIGGAGFQLRNQGAQKDRAADDLGLRPWMRDHRFGWQAGKLRQRAQGGGEFLPPCFERLDLSFFLAA